MDDGRPEHTARQGPRTRNVSILKNREIRIWWATYANLSHLAKLHLRTVQQEMDYLVDQEMRRLEQLAGDTEDDSNEETE